MVKIIARRYRWPNEGINVVTMDEMKHQYHRLKKEIRRLEAVRAEAIRCGDPIPRRLEGDLAEARISAEELRMWGNRELTRQLREAH